MMHGLSRGTRRLSRRLRRKRSTELNIVSMIDILTVLVFFLLVNATGVSILGINLPSSSAAPPTQLPRDLKIVIRTDGLTVADSAGAIQILPNNAAGYDLNGLATVLGQIKDKIPDEDSIKLLLEPGINYDTLVKVMDVARLDPGGGGRQARELFPQISMGDAPPRTAGGAP